MEQVKPWKVLDERLVHRSRWMDLAIADVELPSGDHIEHRVVRYPGPTAGALLRDSESRVLLLWRHRFITGHWGWEIPAGLAEPEESPEDAARRETCEESGWLPGRLEPLIDFDTSSGLMDEHFHAFFGTEFSWRPVAGVADEGAATWLPIGELRDRLFGGEFSHGHSITTILAALQLGLLD